MVQAAHGHKYDHYFKGTARDTAIALRDSPYAVPKGNGSVPGDLLYDFGHGESLGHVAIRLPGNIVGENSVVHWDGKDGRGTRDLSDYDYWDLIVRFPDN